MGYHKWSEFRPPWRTAILHVGGFCAAGFSESGEWLLVISHDGSGLFDCETLERVARDDGSNYGNFDKKTGTAEGIGPLEGTRVPVFGMRGAIKTKAQLPTRTSDGWELRWQEAEERLGMPQTPVYLRPPRGIAWPVDALGEFDALYAIGFSPTGRTLVVAESHTTTVFGRPPDGPSERD